MENTNKGKYNSLDLAKFIAATMIIMLHANPMESVSSTVGSVFRSMVYIIAVPFFFTAGGFLFYDKVLPNFENSKIRLKKYVFNLFRLYLIWSAVYFPFVALEWSKEGIDVGGYIRDFFFEGSFSTIWYLPASIVATIFTYYLYKRLSVKKSFIICLLCYIVGCLFSYYYYIVHSIPAMGNILDMYYSFFKTTKNGILFGAIFVEIGLIIALRKKTLSKKTCFIGCIISYILLVCESGFLPALHILNRSVDLKISLIPFAFFLVLWLLQIQLPDNKIYYWLRKMSTNMFLSQRIFLTLYPMILPADSIWIKVEWCFFVLVYFSTVLFSEMMILIENLIRRKREMNYV